MICVCLSMEIPIQVNTELHKFVASSSLILYLKNDSLELKIIKSIYYICLAEIEILEFDQNTAFHTGTGASTGAFDGNVNTITSTDNQLYIGKHKIKSVIYNCTIWIKHNMLFKIVATLTSLFR